MNHLILPYFQKVTNNFLKAFKPGTKAICFALLSVSAFTVARSQTPSVDINTYVLFAYDEFHFKGRNGGDLTRGVIQGGNVGVNSCNIPNTKNLTFGGPVRMPTNGTQVVGYDVRVEPGSDIWELYANFVQTAFDPAVLRNGPYHSYSCPLIAVANLPVMPGITPGATDVTVEKDQTLALAPGQYANLRVKDGGILNLQAGTYQFNDMSSGKNVTIHTTDGTIVKVARDMSFNNDCYVGPSNLARFIIRSDFTSLNDATINFSRRTEFHGQVFAPNGRINLGDRTDLYGRFWARKMSSDFNVSVYYAAPDDGEPQKRNEKSDPGEISGLKTTLFPSYPNPTSQTSTISYTLGKSENVVLKVYNIAGKEVATLANEAQAAGEHRLQWNAAANPGGVYIVVLKAGSFAGINRLVIMK